MDSTEYKQAKTMKRYIREVVIPEYNKYFNEEQALNPKKRNKQKH